MFSEGRLKRKDNTLFFETTNGQRPVPVEDVEHIYCFSETDFNTKFLDFLGQHNICIHFFNYYGHYSGSFIPREAHLSGYLIVKQVEHYLNPEKRLELARSIIEGAIHNIRRNLEKRDFAQSCEKIDQFRKELINAKSIEEIMSIEAHVRKEYYSCWEEITGWDFEGRSKRPPGNALNALISFGNVLTYTTVLKEIYNTALNPTVSYLHEPSERRYSLALDIAEIFKPVFVDRLVFKLINNNILNEQHFDTNVNSAYMTEAGRKIFVKEYEDLLETTILHRKLKRKIKYKNLIRLDLYKLIKHILAKEKYVPMKVWW